MIELESLKMKLLFIIDRHKQIKTEQNIPFTGNSGFIIRKDKPWYSYRGGPDNLGNPCIMVHPSFAFIMSSNKSEVYNEIYQILKSGDFDSEFIKIYQKYKNSLFEFAMFLQELDLESDNYTTLITYEQLFNMADYPYAHLSLIQIDIEFLYITDNHKNQYLKSFDFFEMLRFRKAPIIQIMTMGLIYANYPINYREMVENYLDDEEIIKYKSILQSIDNKTPDNLI